MTIYAWPHQMCILITLTGCVLPSHVYFNISRADYEFDEVSNEYSYDSDEFDSEEKTFRRICTSNEGSYIANRDNCNRFYVCEQEDERYVDPLVGMCPPGMWFDPNHSDSEVLCVFPEVLCATDHTAAYQYCNCSDMHPFAATQVNGIGGDELEDPMIETSPECIVDNQLHFYPSTVDCGRYFICYNEKVFRMQCKPGFHFNVDMGYCDTAEEAGCKVLDLECPPTGISFLRHPKKCDAFYYCIFGQKSIQACEFYHIWDEETTMCVRRDQARCHLDPV